MIQALYAGMLGLICTAGAMASEEVKGNHTFPLGRTRMIGRSSVGDGLHTFPLSSPEKGRLHRRHGLSLPGLPVCRSDEAEVIIAGTGPAPFTVPIIASKSPQLAALLETFDLAEPPPYSPKRRCLPDSFDKVSHIALPEAFAIEGLRFYVGPQRDAEDGTFLQKAEITHVISIVAPGQKRVVFPSSLAVLHLAFADNETAQLDDPMESAYAFIEEARRMGDGIKCVLVHCYAGQSRSVAILLSYLLQKQWEKPQEKGVAQIGTYLSPLLEEIQGSRPCAAPRLHFMGILQEFENTLMQRSGETRPI